MRSTRSSYSISNRTSHVLRCVFLLLLIGIVMALNISASWPAQAQSENWTEPTVISGPPGFSWFPDLAVDVFGSVHVAWCQTIPLEKKRGLQEQVYYTRWHGESWSRPNDIVPISADIVRNAIAADLRGNIHLLFGGSVYNTLSLYYSNAPVSDAWSAASWSIPHRISQGASYMGDMAIDSHSVIHVVYDDMIKSSDADEVAESDTFYRHSSDGGHTWSIPTRLYLEPLITSARPYLEIDPDDVLHVTWDEGWARLAGATNDPSYGVYTASSDGGTTWAPTTVITYPDSTVAQLTVGSSGEGRVMLVWRSTLYDMIFYQWSTDHGESWTSPAAIPRLFARPWTIPFDMYDMATDSAGNIHLLMVGRRSNERETLLGIYHLVWDGTDWSPPTLVFAEPGLYPEYPKIVIHEGNQLYAAWFTREEDVYDAMASRKVWYSSSLSSAPGQPITPWPTLTPEPPIVTPSPTATITPYPTVSVGSAGLPDGLYTDSDDAARLALALSPVALLFLVLMAIRLNWFGRSRH